MNHVKDYSLGSFPGKRGNDLKQYESMDSRPVMTEAKLFSPSGNYSIFLLQESSQSPNLACAALLLILVLTLTLNSFVFLSVLFSPLRSNLYNAFVALTSAVAVLDGVFNVTSSIVFHASWMELPYYYGENATRKWCRANATILQITGMIQSNVYAALIHDSTNLLPLRNEDFAESILREEKVQKKLKWMLIFSVVIGILMAIPLSLGAFTTVLFEQRMSCSPAYATAQPLTVLLAVLTFVAFATTWLFTIRTSFVIVRKVLNERRRLIDLNLVARQRGAASCNNTELWRQFSPTEGLPFYILTALLASAFFVSVVPNIIVGQVTQFYRSYESQDFYFPNTTLPVDLRLIQTDIFDSIFAWTRHGYNALSPGLILLMHGEIRKQCSSTFCCFVKQEAPRALRSVSAFVRDLKRERTSKDVADYRTPVLFATSEGLHLRTVDGLNPDGEPQFVVTFCDLIMGSKQCNGKVIKPRKNSTSNSTKASLDETFVVKQSETPQTWETFVKCNGFDDPERSNDARSRINTIELDLMSESKSSLLSLPQRIRNHYS